MIIVICEDAKTCRHNCRHRQPHEECDSCKRVHACPACIETTEPIPPQEEEE